MGLVISGGVFPGVAQADCADVAASCDVPLGTYEIALPDTAENAPVVVYLHGYGGNGMGALRQPHIAKVFVERGYAVLAPNGLPRSGGGPNSWSFHPERVQGRDEAAFYAQAVDDAVARFGLNIDRLYFTRPPLVSGQHAASSRDVEQRITSCFAVSFGPECADVFNVTTLVRLGFDWFNVGDLFQRWCSVASHWATCIKFYQFFSLSNKRALVACGCVSYANSA